MNSLPVSMTATIPQEFYYIVGFLIISQLGTIVAFYKNKTETAYKAGYRDAQVDAGIKDAKDTAVRAHKRDDEQDKKIDAMILSRGIK